MKLNKKLVISILLVLMASLLVMQPPSDPDFGWHYRYGEHIVKNLSIPRENSYSYTFTDYQWANSYWLSETIMYLIFHNFGILGLNLIFNTLIFSLLIFVVLKNRSLLTKFLTTVVLSIIISFFIVNVRPLYFSTLFMILLLYVLIEKKEYVKYLPFLFLIWANMHTDFLLGLFIFGLFTLEKIIRKYQLNIKQIFKDFKNVFIMILPLILSLFFTLINPYGLDLLLTLLKEMNNVTFGFISEVSPLTLSNKKFFTKAGFYVWSAINLLVVIKSNKRFGIWYLVSGIFFFAMGIFAHYFYRVFYILSLFSLRDAIQSSAAPQSKLFRNDHIIKGIKIFAPIFILLAITISADKLNYALDDDAWQSKSRYPQQAIEFIKQNPQEGRMINHYGWGGYLIWKLPEYKTFIDGRMASWRDENNTFALEEYKKIFLETTENKDLFNKYVSEHNITWTLAHKKLESHPDTYINNYLQSQKSWEKIYEDEIAIIYSKR